MMRGKSPSPVVRKEKGMTQSSKVKNAAEYQTHGAKDSKQTS